MFRAPLRNRWFADSLLEEAVTSELVSGSENSLLIRENTGNFADFDPASPIRRPKLPLYLVAYLANSLGNRTGN